ncbi:MAG: P-II family nitrogen regulator, partial [Acidaminococcaceae bacterium]|nr:P-II family nitrogen regulator [Acidaminococcaceae bacterium]
FGVFLASEKDLTFIVSKKSQKNSIMQAVMQKAGMETPAKSIVFSLPVSDTAGLHIVEEENGQKG